VSGDVEQVKQLLDQGYQIRQQHARGLSALHEAVSRGQAEVVALFMAAGADPDDTTALGVAVREGHAEMVRMLTDKGLLNRSSDYPDYYLYDAALGGHTEITAILLEVAREHLDRIAALGRGFWYYRFLFSHIIDPLPH